MLRGFEEENRGKWQYAPEGASGVAKARTET